MCGVHALWSWSAAHQLCLTVCTLAKLPLCARLLCTEVVMGTLPRRRVPGVQWETLVTKAQVRCRWPSFWCTLLALVWKAKAGRAGVSGWQSCARLSPGERVHLAVGSVLPCLVPSQVSFHTAYNKWPGCRTRRREVCQVAPGSLEMDVTTLAVWSLPS